MSKSEYGKTAKDKLYEKLANSYVEQEGSRILDELDELNARGESYVTGLFDARIKKRISANKRARTTRVAALISAACIVLVIAPAIIRVLNNKSTTDTPEYSSESGVADNAASEEAAPPRETGTLYEVIALSANLSNNFSIESYEQDVSKTVYYIDDTYSDDVVLTLEKIEHAKALETDELSELIINGHLAYGYYGPDYSIVTFEADGIVYSMTCKHDINTLVSLSESILV